MGNETTAVSFPMEMGRLGNGTTHRASPTGLSKSENVENGAGSAIAARFERFRDFQV